MKQQILLLFFFMGILTFCNAQNAEKNNTDFFDESNKTSSDSLPPPTVVTAKGVQEKGNIVPMQPSQFENTEGTVAMMQFEKRTVDFGVVKFGETRTHIFTFKNISNEPLTIDIISACDCTDLEYTHEVIPVGGAGYVKATYHSDRTPEAVNGSIHKDITIILKNQAKDTGYPIIEELFLKASIVE
jgi:Protein of unknown function (DUF1573)